MKPLLLLAALGAILHAQVIRAIPYHLERLDPSLDSIISADSPLEILGEHFGLTEGPVWVKDSGGGYLCWFSDCAGTDNLNVGQQTIAGRRPSRRRGRPAARAPLRRLLPGEGQKHPGDFRNVTAGFRKTMAYDVLPDDTVANPRVFLNAGNDGMKTDNQGNVFQVNAVGQGQVLITAPSGKRLGTIQLPQIGGEARPRICASNVAFGDAGGKELYITSCTHVFRVRLKVSGLR